MSVKLRVLIIACMILSIFYIVRNVQKKIVSFKYGLGWILISVVIMIFAISPAVLTGISHFFGVADPVNMLFFMGMILLILIIFSLSKSVSDLSDKVKQLAQELAIAKKDIYDHYSSSEENHDKAEGNEKKADKK